MRGGAEGRTVRKGTVQYRTIQYGCAMMSWRALMEGVIQYHTAPLLYEGVVVLYCTLKGTVLVRHS